MTESFGKKWPTQIAFVVLAILAVCLPALAQQPAAPATSSNSVRAVLAASATAGSANKSDAAAAQAAFNRAWTVFDSPRCRNCHPSGDAPLQGWNRLKLHQVTAGCCGWLAARDWNLPRLHCPVSRTATGILNHRYPVCCWA